MDYQDLDIDTLVFLFRKLGDHDHMEAAVLVATFIIEAEYTRTAEQWAKDNAHRYDDKIQFIKALRAEYDGMKLKEAKSIIDPIW